MSNTNMTPAEVAARNARVINHNRLAYLISQGEDIRNTPAWRDAKFERAMLIIVHTARFGRDMLACK